MKVLKFFLATLIVVSSVFTVHAEEDSGPPPNEVPEEVTEGGSEGVPEKINLEEEIGGETNLNNNDEIAPIDATGGYAILINGGNNLEVSYLEPIELSLQGYGGSSNSVHYLYYTPGNEDEKLELSNGACSLEPGSYVMTYYYQTDQDIVESTDIFSLTVTKAQISAPGNLRWDGSNPKWDTITTTTDNGSLPEEVKNALSYKFNVYKSGNYVATYTATSTGITNFNNNILNDTGLGSGSYSFEVEATVPENYHNHFDNPGKAMSQGAFVVPHVSVVAGSGIDSVSTVTDHVYVMIPGDATPLNVSATVKEGYSFSSWTGDGVTFTTASDNSTGITVNANYSGPETIFVTATARDVTAPNVGDPSVDVAGNNTIKSVINDQEDGLKFYAFSTETNAGNVSNWVEIQPVTGSNTYTYTVTESGTYYAFAKDVEGNTSRSSEGIKATKLTMHNYPKEGGTTGDESAFIIGSSGVTLPTDLTRNGYTFGGWYTENSYENEAQTSYDSHDQNIEVYAKWDENKLPTNIEISGIDCTYDGTEKTLQVPQESLVNKGKITYQWYKGDTLIDGATSSSLKVKNVADSGDYKVLIKLFDDADQPLDETTISGVSAAISKADLKVVADNKEVYFNEDPPAYTYTFVEGFGFKNNDDEVDLSSYLTCTYAKGNKVDDYTISWENIELDNYNVTTTSGKLTVTRVSSELSVEFADDVTDLHYTGQAITPAVTVKLGERTLEEDEYSVTYSDNTNAGQASLTVDLLGNYTGSKTLNFTIKKATISPKVTMSGWMYGETASDPVLEDNSDENGAVTFLYGLKDSEDFNTGKPTQAGTYEVYATVAETDNYEAATTDKVTFEIAKRNIEITANSATFTYDGLAHSDNGYTTTGDGFAYGESFYSVSVNGSVTDVTDETATGNNTITYTLSSNTSADNYNITTVPGTLTVVPFVLATPFDIHWNTAQAGQAAWVKVSRKNLSVKYQLQLYAFDGTDYIPVGSPVETTDNTYDFKSAIKDHVATADEGVVYSYSFTIQTIPENNENYASSPISEKTGNLYTTILKVTGDNLASTKLNGSEATELIVLNGESVSLRVTTEDGYQFDYDNSPSYNNASLSLDGTQEDTGYTATITPHLSASNTGETITFATYDIGPEITDFTANLKPEDNFAKVGLSANASDAVGIVAWAISTAQPTSDEAWNTLESSVTELTSDTLNVTVEQPGAYYVYVKDTADNVSVSEKAIKIYQINYLKGNESATGTMASMLKVENQKLTLPEVDYQYEGHSFKNWRGSTGTYEDKGVMVANPENTLTEDLTAVWSLDAHTYTVNYYLMGLDGNYPETATSSKEFFASYGSTVHSNDAAIQLDQMGFTLDTTEGKIEEKLIKTDGEELNVYYQRNKYNLTTSYTRPDSSEATTVTNEYYYDSDITGVLSDANKPSVDSFVFVGWSFGDNGKKPDKMPANDVVATGYFVPEQVTYNIRYYLQDLDEAGETVGDSYTLVESYNRSLKATYGDTLTFSDYVEVPDGFKFAGVHVTHGEETAPTTDTIEFVEGDTTTAGVNDTLNIYFTREKYKATLNVWKGKVNGEIQYTEDTELYYGAKIPATLPTLNQANWGLENDLEYKLADYVGWSTGEAPTTMPAGDITVTRQYVKKVTGYYQVEVYLETETDDVYESPRIFTFYDNVGTGVSVGTEETDTIKLASFANGINYWEFYDYATVTEGDKPTKLSGNVTDTNEGEDPLVLRVYMNRKVVTSTISYYADNVKIATVQKSAKWGHTYHYDALSLFDSNAGGVWTESDTTSNFSMLTTVAGSNPDVYDFRNNNYVVAYSGQYIMNDVYKWPQRNYDTVDSLTKNDEIIMGQKSNTCSVRYSKADPLEMYRILLTYNSTNLSHGVNKVVNLTYTANETTYNKIYIANEAYFFNNVTYSAEGYENYPGLAFYNKGLENSENCKLVYSTDDSNLKDGYSKVTIDGKTYYTSVEGDSNVLYIPEPNNTYFVGKWTSANASGKPGYQDAVDYLTNYKATWSEDQYAQGAYIYSSGWGSTVKYDTSDATLTITYRNGNVYQISYNLGGAICSDESHRFAASTVIDTTNPSQFGCEHPLMVQRAGYDIVWYEDGGFTTKPSGTFKLTNNKTFYGRYEKSILYNTAYEYYELANYLDGVKYITKDNVDSLMAQYPGRLESVPETTQSTITDEFGNSVTVDITTTTYTLDGAAVMKKTQVPSLSFTDVTYTNSDQTGNGLKYDSSNPINIVKGYVQSDPIEFVTYYSRDKVELIVDKKIPKGNEEQSLHRKGETITLADPTRDGYTFAGWEWYYKDNDAYTKYSSFTSSHDEEAQTTTFTMPAQDIKVVATWTASNYDQTIYHYFQNVNTRTYDKETIATLISAAGSTTTVSFNNATYDATLYGNGFVSIVMGNETYYFTKAVDGTVAIEDLSAIVEKPSTLQDETVTVSDGLKNITHYNYVYTLRQYEETIEQLASSNTYVNQYGMIVEHFYSLEEFTITTAYKSIGATGNVALIGDGTYMYGSTATLKASYSAGFSFVGWYKTNDLPTTLTETSLEDVTKVSETASFSAKVTADESYTAVILANDVDTPDLEIVGCDSFEYNDSTTHAVKIKATFKEDASDASYIKGYQWYEGTTPITGATSSSFTIPVDWDAGEHVLKCVVTVARKDNGVEKEITSDTTTITITAVSLEEYFKAKNHSAKYDGTDNHAISVVCTPKNGVPASSDYDIYYSETELTSDNYQSGSTDNLKYKDVKTVEVDGVVTRSFYTVYYYVAPKSTNYSGFGGSATVEIKPVSLTLSAGSASYSKEYDGNAEVKGDLNTSGSDLYNLVRGANIYTINGLINSDKANTYIIDCNASFNSRHVSDASAVTLSNIVLANDAGDIQYNYIFADTYSINLTGYIDPKSITLSWDTNSFEYDGAEHCPTATLPTTICEIDKDNLSVSVTGGQTNVGSAWNAVAKMVSSDANTQTGDYSLSNQTKTYAITKKEVTFTFDNAEVTYDGDNHTLANSSIKTGALIDGQSYTCDSDKSEKNVGEYDITPTNIKISDANGADMTGNYQITTEPGKLTIKKQAVTVSGIVVENKDYDGTTDATVNLDSIVFTGLIEGDQLALDASKVSAVFDDKNAGVGKSATITINADALSGSDVGNYELNIVDSQKTTTATINKLPLTVTPGDKTITYGTSYEDVGFDSTYSGFIENESTANVEITGTISYQVGTTSANKAAYDGTQDVGTYKIYSDSSSLSATNYYFTDATGNLTITKRPITIVAKAGVAAISKVYDGTVSVKDTLVKDTHYTLEKWNEEVQSGVVNNDTINVTYTAAYNSKDVNTDQPIKVNGLQIDNNNYELKTTEIDLPGEITQAELKVTAVNKTLTYGSTSNPTYTVKYEGFKNGETESVLDLSGLSFACDYDCNDPEKRNATTYEITPSGIGSANYDIKYVKGTLTVNKADLTITTAASRTEINYGMQPIPNFNYSFGAFKYDDNESVITVKNSPVTYNLNGLTQTAIPNGETTRNVVNSIPGSYSVKVNSDNFESDNYKFTINPVGVTVNKMNLTITGIVVENRIYDRTTNVYTEQYNFSNVVHQGLLKVDEAEWAKYAENPLNGWFTITDASYNSKNVSEANTVTFTLTFGEYLAKRYNPVNNQNSASSNLVKRDVLITAKDKEVLYGHAAPNYEVTYGKYNGNDNSGLVTGDTANIDDVTVTSSYDEHKPVGEYEGDIVVSDFNKTNKAYLANYEPQYQAGKLTVKQYNLDTPSPVWSETTIGKVTWNAVNPVSDVNVDSYEVQLRKNGTAVGDLKTVSASAALEYNFLEDMRSNGAGEYTVAVKAIPSLLNNVDKKNVGDSFEGISNKWYAASVNFVKYNDTITNAAFENMPEPEINSADSYVVVAGEENIPITAEMKNATGYTIDSITSIDEVTIATPSVTGANIASTISLSKDYKSANPIQVVLKLNARPATLDVVVKPLYNSQLEVSNETTYGYSEATAPKLKATVSHEDEVSPAGGYTYSYTWEIKNPGVNDKFEGGTDTFTFPTGKSAYANYLVRCVVTATRNDNGQSTTLNETFSAFGSKWAEDNSLYQIKVNRAKFTASVAIENWTYGEAQKNPTLTSSVDSTQNPKILTPKYEYRVKDTGTWTTTKPENAGDYQIRAYIEESANYSEFTTPVVDFTINKAQLAIPQNLRVSPSADALYGVISWDAVTGPMKNGNGAQIGVTYDVTLEKYGEPYKSYSGLTTTSLDITEDLEPGATYHFSVQAKSSDTDNCLDSDKIGSDSKVIYVTASITITDNGENRSAPYSKKYDGTPITLTVTHPDGEFGGYQWYKDNVPIDGATNNTYTLTHVADSGNYACVVTLDGFPVYSPSVNVTIIKRTLKFRSNDAEKVYDGTPLINNSVTDTFEGYDGFAQGEGATYTWTGTATNVSDTSTGNNTFTWSFDDKTTANDYETPVINQGTLTITPRTITDDNTVFTVESIDARTYDATEYKPTPTITDKGLATSTDTELGNDDFTYSYTNNINASTDTSKAVVTIAGKGNYTGSTTREYVINKRSITFTGEDKVTTYSGSEQKTEKITITGDGLVSGHTHDLTFEAKATEARDTAYSGTITQANDVHIKDAQKNDVTSNYAITVVNGSIKINKTTEALAITFADDSHVYNTQPQHHEHPAKANEKTGITTFKYKFDDTDYTSDLSALKKTDVGEYNITVEATNPNYANAATATAKLKITEKPITVNVVGNYETATYDGTEHSQTGFVATTEDDAYDVTKVTLKAGVTASAKRTDAGTTKMGLTKDSFVNNDPNYKVNFVVTDGYVTINPRTIQNTDFDVASITPYVYGDTAYTPTPTVTDNGLATNTATDLVVDKDFTYSYSNNINATTDTSKAVVTITGQGNYTGSISRTFEINKRPIKFTGVSTTVTYTGSEQSIETYTVNTDAATNKGLVTGHTHNFTYKAKGIEASTTPYAGELTAAANVKIYKDANKTNEVTENYDITVENGTITINQSDVEWEISLANDSHQYDGNSHYNTKTAVSRAATGTTAFQYSLDNVNFKTNLNELTRKDFGTNTIYVKATNPNYTKTATATATLSITAKPIEVKITGNHIENVYDGTAHVINDYVPSTTETLYDTRHVVLTGTASATQTNVGTTYMGLTPEMFSNNDPNFAVTFKVTDGYSKITERTINDTDFTVASISSFIYNDEAYEPKPTVTDTNLATDSKTAVLVEGTDFTYRYANNTNASTDASKATVTITGKGNYKGSITKEFKITKRVLTITGDSDLNAIYNRNEQKITTYTTNTDETNKTGLVDGHDLEVTYEVKGTDARDEVYTGTITDADKVKVLKGTTDVTSNYSITTTPGTLKINKSTESWEIGLANNSYVYDATEHDLGKTPTVSDARGTTTYGYSFVEDGSYVDDLTSLKQTNVGAYKIYVKATNTNYVNEAKTEATLSITKRPVTFTGKTSSEVYTGSEIELTDVSNNYSEANKTGLIPSHTHNVTYSAKGIEVNGSPYTGTITDATDVEIKNGDDVVTNNYEISTEPGKLTITQSNADWTISLDDDTYTYDGATHYINKTPTSTALTGTTSYSYKFEDDADYVSDLSSLTKVDAGTYTIKVKATNPNYSKTAECEAKLIISRRAVEFNAEIARKEYTGDKLSIDGVTITEGQELPNGHTHNVEYLAEGTEASATPYKGSITAKDRVRIYNGSKEDVTANFDITVNEGGLEIYKTDDTWSISLESESIKYDGSSHALSKVPTSTAKTGTTTYEYSFDENGTYVSNLSSLTKVDAGTYTIYVKAKNPNYEKVATTTATLTIEKRTIKFTGKSETKVYTGQEQIINTVDITGDGLASNQTHNVEFSASGTEVNVYTGTITLLNAVSIKSGTEDVTHNYIVEVENGTLTISKKSGWSISLVGTTVTYDGNSHAITNSPTTDAVTGTTTYTYSFDQNGDYVSDLSSLKKVNAGTYTVYVKAINPNYEEVAIASAILKINTRPVTFTGKSEEHTYTGDLITINKVDVTGEGLVENHTSNVSFTASGTEVDGSPYTGNITALNDVVIKNGDEIVTDNYAITVNNGTLTINKKSGWNISLVGTTVTYDGNSHAITNSPTTDAVTGTTTYTYSFDENGTYESNLSSLTKVNAGTYTVYVKATNPNYEEVATTQANLTINQRPVTFTGKSEEHTYTGDLITINKVDVTGEGLVENHTSNVSFTASGTEVDGSPYTGNITALNDVVIKNDEEDVTNNYAITVNNGTLTINKKSGWNISLVGTTVTYDGNSHAIENSPRTDAVTGTTTYTYSFDQNGTYVSNLSSLTKVDAGTYTVYVKATNPNYEEVATTQANLTINQRPVTFTGETNTKVYTGSDIELTGVSDNYSEDDKTGLVSGHTSNVAYSAKGKEVSATAYPGTITDKNDVVIMNGAADVTDNYDITVDPGSLTIIQSNAEWTIDLEDSEFTYDTGAHHITSTPESHAASGTTTYEYSFNENSGYVRDLTSLEKTDVEEYTVYVKATNPNYSKTAQTTAKLKIKQKDVKVTITGHTVTQTYNNTTYTAEGYDFNADYDKYQQDYVNFSATALVSRKDAGKAMMGLADTQFTNTNANYNVTFEVTDGYVEINPIDDKVTVTIVGDTVSKTYDGTTYTAKDYAFSSDNTLYLESYVDFKGSATVSGKDVNKSMMNLDATQFTNNSDNFTNVEFVVTDGYVEITKRKVTITVTNSNKTFGEEDPTFEGQISNLVKGESIVGLSYVRTNTGIEVVGEYEDVLSATYGDNPNYDIEVIPANFEIVQAGSLSVNGTNYYSTYDGQVHGTPARVNVTEGTTITYSIDGGNSWSDTVPTIKDVGVVNVTVKATHHDYAEYTDTYKLEVIPLPIDVAITGVKDSRQYDGEIHEVNGYTWSASNDLDLYKDTYFDFNGSARASQKDKGKTFMNLDKDDFTNKNGNFDVTFSIASDGYQEITAKKGVVVTITGHTHEDTYDSYKHEITGYDFVPNTNLYTTNDYNFSGIAKAERVEFGQTQMNLSAAQFTNTSDNFENVVFNVTDGYQKINKVTDKVTVTITGHTNSKTYDGTMYTASGYDFEANNALYTVNDIVFAGNAYAAQKGVKTAYMGLSSGQFSNKSANFADVEFVVTDGYVEITKRPVVITVANGTKVFGTTDPVITGDVTNLVDGDPIINLAYVRENKDEVVGTYEKVLSATYDEHPNYAISVVKGKFEITKANTLSVSGTDYKQAYDGSEHGLAAKANVEEGTTYKYSIDNGTSWVSEVPTIKDVGKLEVKVIAEHHDYESAENNYTLEVLPKAVKVTVKDATKVYGDEDPEKFDSEVDGLIGEDKVTYTIKRGNGEKVDDYPIKATGDEFQGNYQVSYEDGEFTITPRVIEFEWDEVDYTYDGSEKEVMATISNIVSWNDVEDDVTIDTYDENKASDAGEYIAKVVDITGKDSDNYKLDKVTYEWMIKRAKPVIKPKENVFDYDGKSHTAEAELTLGDGVLKSENATQTNSGTYPVTFYVDQTKNFEALKVDAKLTILPRTVEAGGIEITDIEDIIVDGGDVVFPEIVVKDTKADRVLVKDKDYRATFDNDRSPGEHELVVDFMGNYGGKFRKKYRILPANVDSMVEESVPEEYPSIKQEVDVLEETVDEEEKVETGVWVEEKVSEIVEAIPVEIYSDDPGDTWAIIDLLIMVVMASLTIMLVLNDDKSQEEDEEKKKRIEYYRKALKAASVIITLIAIITFYFTEDMSNYATLIGVYTIYYVIAFILQIFINIFGVNRDDDGSNHHFA